MTSDAYGFGQLNKEISFLILYICSTSDKECMHGKCRKWKDVQHQCRQIDQKEDARSKREVTLTQNDECTKAHFYIKLRREKIIKSV